jgi:hypothetical protein
VESDERRDPFDQAEEAGAASGRRTAEGGRINAVSPDASTVFVTGGSPGLGTGSDYATIAYSAVSDHE